MSEFIGRTRELTLLRNRLDRVTHSGSGLALSIRGRRQVGKSRLVQEFCTQAAVPYFFFTATKGASPVESIASFFEELPESTLISNQDLVPASGANNWRDAFRLLNTVLPNTPAVVVIDETPWLAEQDDLFEGSLQTAWDRLFAPRPILLLLLGSDLHMMERLSSYDRPFYGRADNLVLGPLNVADTAQATGLDAADAIDAHLLCGGLPGILRLWPQGTPALDFLKSQCDDPSSPLFGVPESALMAEFPTPDQARRVLEAVGSGERTFSNIAAKSGNRHGALPSGALSPLLYRLTEEKRILAQEFPLSTKATKPALYRIADSNLRFYLAAGRTAHEQILRGRATEAFNLLRKRWPAWRGKAVEPLIRESLEIAAYSSDFPWQNVEKVGGWWNRQFEPEIDLVGADHGPVAERIYFVGSIKWLSSPLSDRDVEILMKSATQIPGFTPGKTGNIVVSLSGISPRIDTKHLDLVWGPSDVVSVWT